MMYMCTFDDTSITTDACSTSIGEQQRMPRPVTPAHEGTDGKNYP